MMYVTTYVYIGRILPNEQKHSDFQETSLAISALQVHKLQQIKQTPCTFKSNRRC